MSDVARPVLIQLRIKLKSLVQRMENVKKEREKDVEQTRSLMEELFGLVEQVGWSLL